MCVFLSSSFPLTMMMMTRKKSIRRRRLRRRSSPSGSSATTTTPCEFQLLVVLLMHLVVSLNKDRGGGFVLSKKPRAAFARGPCVGLERD